MPTQKQIDARDEYIHILEEGIIMDSPAGIDVANWHLNQIKEADKEAEEL